MLGEFCSVEIQASLPLRAKRADKAVRAPKIVAVRDEKERYSQRAIRPCSGYCCAVLCGLVENDPASILSADQYPDAERRTHP